MSDGIHLLIQALTILDKYLKGYDRNYPTHCEHDVMYVGVDPADVGPEDTAALAKLGFYPDPHSASGAPCFKSHRFGSA